MNTRTAIEAPSTVEQEGASPLAHGAFQTIGVATENPVQHEYLVCRVGAQHGHSASVGSVRRMRMRMIDGLRDEVRVRGAPEASHAGQSRDRASAQLGAQA